MPGVKRRDIRPQLKRATPLPQIKQKIPPEASCIQLPPLDFNLQAYEPVLDKDPNAIKILWFYRYLSTYDFDNWLHMKFAEALSRDPMVNLMAYGPGLHLCNPKLVKVKYDQRVTIQDIAKEFNFDAMIMNTKSRMFFEYNPHEQIAKGQWLPHNFSQANCPKIVIEEDYHYEKNDQWYLDNKIDLILQRHWSQSLRQNRVPMQWLPFSVDRQIFHPFGPRYNKICFAGSTNADVYRMRNQACEILGSNKMIDVFSRKEKIGESYSKCLQQYVSHLSCSSTYNLSSAKMFEIMSSGSVLLTNENDDLKLLYDEDSYRTYKRDLSNIVSVAQDILNDGPRTSATIERGLATISARHTHEKRISELVQIINGLRNLNAK